MTGAVPLTPNSRVFKKRRIAAAVMTLLACFGVYSALVAAAPLPPLHATLTSQAHAQFSADDASAQAAVNAQTLPTATGWLDQQQVWANTNDSFRIASLTKLITVLVGLEKAPFAAGTPGPSYTLTEADSALVNEVIAQNGSFAPAPSGAELTSQQILDLILVPSANNYAISYARWIFGSDAAFLEAANSWLRRHDLTSVHIEEAAGLSDNNVASPADVVRITRLALAQPVIAATVKQSHVSIPAVGEITTTNPLLGEAGVIGVKTGTTFPDGYSLAAARHETIGEDDHVAIAVTLQRSDGASRAADTRSVLDAMASSGSDIVAYRKGEAIGAVTTWEGSSVPVVTASTVSETLVPGETFSTLTTLSLRDGGPRGARAGTITVVSPHGKQEAEVITAEEIAAPNFAWRASHPRDILRWYQQALSAK